MGPPILSTNSDLSQRHWRDLVKAAGGKYRVVRFRDLTQKDYADVEALLLEAAGRWLTAENMRLVPNVRFIQTISAGLDGVDFSVIPENVLVCGNSGACGRPMAEFVFGAIAYLGKDLAKNHENLKKGIFEHGQQGLYLYGKTIGILGAGGIGGAVAKLAKCYGMRTVGVNRGGQPAPNFDEVFSMEGLEKVLRSSDLVVLSLPLTLNTFHLLDSSKLETMKSGCILVNVGRANLIEERALYEHLRAHPTFKAATDVWWVYPKPGEKFSQHFPFLDLPNFLGSPHTSAILAGSVDEIIDWAIRNVGRHSRGEPVLGRADRNEYLWGRDVHLRDGLGPIDAHYAIRTKERRTAARGRRSTSRGPTRRSRHG